MNINDLDAFVVYDKIMGAPNLEERGAGLSQRNSARPSLNPMPLLLVLVMAMGFGIFLLAVYGAFALIRQVF